MVIDNVDDKDIFFRVKTRGGYSCWECVPKCKHGSLLFTTRSYDIAVDLADGAKPIEVPAMPQEAGKGFIKQRLGPPGSESEKDIVDFMEVVDGIPLAMSQALSLIVKRKWTIRQCVDKYRTNDEYKKRFLSYEFMDHTRDTDSTESVVKTWMISFNSIKRESFRAEDIMFLMSFLQSHSIPRGILREVIEDEFDFESALECLLSFSFIDQDVSGTFRTHRLVQIATKIYLMEQGLTTVEEWAFKALKAVSRKFPDMRSVDNPTYSKDCEVLMPHVESVLAATTSQQSDCNPRMVERVRLLRNSGRYFFLAGHHDEAIRRCEESFNICARYLGVCDIEYMDSASALGVGHLFQGNSAAARPILRQVLNSRMTKLGKDDPRTIDSLGDFAISLSDTDPVGSEDLQREAYQHSLRTLGPRHDDTLNCMQHLADILCKLGRFKESEKLHREAVAIRKDVLGHGSLDTITAEQNLAVFLDHVGDRVDEASGLYKTCLAMCEQLCGYDHRDTLVCAVNYAMHLQDKGSLDDARSICERALNNAAGGLRKDVSQTQIALSRLRDLLNKIEMEQSPAKEATAHSLRMDSHTSEGSRFGVTYRTRCWAHWRESNTRPRMARGG